MNESYKEMKEELQRIKDESLDQHQVIAIFSNIERTWIIGVLIIHVGEQTVKFSKKETIKNPQGKVVNLKTVTMILPLKHIGCIKINSVDINHSSNIKKLEKQFKGEENEQGSDT